MSTRTIGVIMNGVTGRMGANQHLLRSILPIIRQGGAPAADTLILPEPLLVGRNAGKLEAVARAAGLARWTTDLDSALSDPRMSVYFDAQTTLQRAAGVRKAIAAGKHVYCEKPTAPDLPRSLGAVRPGPQAGGEARRGPGQAVAARAAEAGRPDPQGLLRPILSVRGEFGYWVFEGDVVPAQRPSWNYRLEEGGGIVLDMFCHWRYVLDNLFGKVKAVSCLAATHIPERWDEAGKALPRDRRRRGLRHPGAGQTGSSAHINSSWAVRVRRDDLLTLQVDGTRGSAVAGLRDCWIQPYNATPRPVWNPDLPNPIDFLATWQKLPEQKSYDNAFKAQWELFLRHVALDEPFPWNLLEGAKGVQLAEAALESSRLRRWVDIPELGEG